MLQPPALEKFFKFPLHIARQFLSLLCHKRSGSPSAGAIALMLCLSGSPALAGGLLVDKVYHPYVEALEQELGWRATWQDHQRDEADRAQRQHASYGRAFGERWFGELNVISAQSASQSLAIEAVELEAIHQLTEQGEYWADWGLLLELEKDIHEDAWELASGILVEKELGQWSLAANLIVSREWGSDTDSELESEFALQARYRYARHIEPALEFYGAEDGRALGPALMGDIRFGMRRALHWELGLLFGLDHDSPDNSLRAGIEYGF